MRQQTEIYTIDKDGLGTSITNFPYQLFLKKGDIFYYSVREPYLPEIEKYKKNIELYFRPLVDGYIESIHKKCEEYHIKKYKVVSISYSLQENYDMGLCDSSNLMSFTTSIEVKEYITISQRVRKFIRLIKKLWN